MASCCSQLFQESSKQVDKDKNYYLRFKSVLFKYIIRVASKRIFTITHTGYILHTA